MDDVPLPLLKVQELRTGFVVGGQSVSILNGVSFELSQGEVMGVVGESGSGKSMTALSIMRLLSRTRLAVTGGKVLWLGRDLLTLDDKAMQRTRGKEIAMIFQDPMTSLNPILTVGRQMTEALQFHLKMGKSASVSYGQELLELVGIPDPARRMREYPHQFSGGMRQRAMIAMALSCDPRLLICDEPTTALDVTVQAQILELLKRLAKERNMAVILITHDLGVVAGLADRVCVMYAGNVVETGTVDEVFKQPQHPYTLALLKCVPGLDHPRKEAIPTIRGAAPDLLKRATGCMFRPRCTYAVATCADVEPKLRGAASMQQRACHVNIWDKLSTKSDTKQTN